MTVTTAPHRASAPPKRQRRSLLRIVARVIALLVVVATLWVVSVAGRIWWTAREDNRPKSDVIVVLGASQYNGKPSPVFAWRLTHAKALWSDSVASTIVTVGGRLPGDQFTEGGAGRDYLVSHGVPPGDVVAVTTGSDTLASLQAVDKVAQSRGWTSVVLVTDPWHSFRAEQMAQSLGLNAATSPTRSGPVVQTRGTEYRYIVRETAAYVFWRLTGRSPGAGRDG